MNPASPPPPKPTPTIRRRYGVDECLICGFAVQYCGCARTQADAPPADGDESQLRQRIAEVVAKRTQAGGR